MPLFQIKDRYVGKVLFECEAVKVKEALVNAVDSGADLSGADLSGAYLSGADLSDADLSDADLRDADLSGAKISWSSHWMIAELLRRVAGDDIAKLKVAGLVSIQREWCWDDFAAKCKADPLWPWAIEELAKWVQDGDNAPELLKLAQRKETVSA